MSAPVRVLIADDQALHRDMLARAIHSAGLAPSPTIVHAANGREALDALRSGVDVAFLDIRMPGMSGLEVLTALREEGTQHAIPIIIVSSSSDPRDVSAAEGLGVAGYIEKGRYPEFRARVIETLRAVWADKRK